MALKLYAKEGCPYCRKVIDQVGHKVTLEIQDAHRPHIMQELLALGGQATVPFLHDTDAEVLMYESDDIITYLNSKQQ